MNATFSLSFLDRIGINMGGLFLDYCRSSEVLQHVTFESLLASLLCHMYQMCLTMHEMLVFPFATNVNNLEYIHKTIKLFMKLQLFFLKAKKRVFLIIVTVQCLNNAEIFHSRNNFCPIVKQKYFELLHSFGILNILSCNSNSLYILLQQKMIVKSEICIEKPMLLQI